MNLEFFLKAYLKARPLFLSLIRAKEAYLFQKYLPLPKPVLDVGAGDGFFAKTAFGGKVDVGLDVEGSRMEEARMMGVYKKIVIYDGERMPFEDNVFATVVSNCVLEHIPNIKKTTSEIYRVSKPGGLFLTTVVAKPWEDYLFGGRLLGDFYKQWMRKKQVHFNMNTYKEWEKIFKSSGFKITEEKGYLNSKAVSLIDIFHYLSIPSLLTYKYLGKWVLFKDKINFIPLKIFSDLIKDDVPYDKSGNIFFALKK